MTRLYIVDQSGLEPGGHYYAYTGCVVDGARRLGLDTTVLANKKFRLADGTAPQAGADIIPCFTYTWGEAEQHGTLGWEQGNIAYELYEAFRRLPPAPDDHVFLHTFGYLELTALLRWLTEKLPGDPLPYFHLLLRRDPDLLIENDRQYAGYFGMIAASPFLREKVRLHTDTHLLSEAFATVCGVPFATAPIPFDQTLLQRSLAARRLRRPGEPLTIVYLGDAREEKGYQHLPQALAYLWKDYLSQGRVRFVLQSNFNTPGGEPGILAASQNLASFLGTTLKNEPLQPAAYYEILADSDIVLIPYSAQRYRYRSSGVLVEAMGAGKVVVTSADSWMATQVTPDHAVLFETPAGLGPAIAQAIDRFDTLSAGAAARRDAVLASATGENLVRHLLTETQAAQVRSRTARKRVLLVMNGDAMVLKNGASRVALAQLRYLTAAGHDVVGLFLTYDSPASSEAFIEWRTTLTRSIASFPIERIFVTGPGRWGSGPDQSPEVRNQRQWEGAPLRAEMDFVAGFEFGAPLLAFLRSHPIDAVLLNYITNYPVIEALGLGNVPVICEMHDLQSFQRAIYGHRLVDDKDLQEEFEWLARCAALVSLNPRETAIVRNRLPDMKIETTGVFLPTPPPALPSLAGAKDLSEIVSSSGPHLPHYQFETAWEIGQTEDVQRLIDAGSLDLLYVSSAHMANVSGLRWFLSEVYEPYLARHQVSFIVAGSIARIGGWPQHPRVFFIDQVEDLGPLYAAARVVVLPITEGAGSPVKTYEALAYGRPIVGTSQAFRGIDSEPGDFIIRDDPQALADAVLDLISSAEERRQAAEKSRRMTTQANDIKRYFRIMDGLFGPLLGGKPKPTPVPATPPVSKEEVEWSPPLQALNRVVRSYLDGEPLEGWALDLLAQQPQDEIGELAERICNSLLEARDAAVLHSELRLKRYVARSFFDKRLRQDTLFTVQAAVAERRGAWATPIHRPTIRAVVFGGLPLTVAGNAGEPGERAALIVDDRRVTTRMVADTGRYGGRSDLFQAEIPASTEALGLRTIELAVAPARSGKPARGRIAVLRHSVPITPGVRLLERDVFGGGFEPRSDGTGIDLPPGEAGLLQLPRIADGQHASYVDLCFSRFEAADQSSPRETGLAVMLGKRSADIEIIGSGALRIVRVFVTGDDDLEEFGIVALTVVNRGTRSTPRLIGVHSGLLLGSLAEAAAAATVLSLAGHRLDQASYPRLAGLARDAIATLIAGEAPAADALDALCTLAASTTGQDGLRSVAAQELARASRQNRATRDIATLIEDVHAIVGSALGTVAADTAVFAPALPIEIIEEAGEILPAQTEAARRSRAGSWRVQMPDAGGGERICIRLDAALEIPEHPGVVTYNNFYPAEDPNAPFRWTGPGPTSTVALPLVLNKPSRLIVELGSVGRNGGREDFTLTCNGQVAVHNFELGGDDIVRLTADLPPSRLAGPSTEIALTVKERFRPELPDRRTLGVVFRSVSLLIGGPELTALGDRRHADIDAELSADPGTFGRVTAEPPVGLRPGNIAGAAAAEAAPATRRALVIDDSVPEPDKDAGSNAILQHSLSLQRLGYSVGFAPADNMARIEPYTAALEQRGIECFHRPDYGSVADVLARQAPYDLVYLHRHANMTQHGAAVRAHSPQARLVFSVADLHFLRLERQAELEGDAALRRQADALRAAELAAVAAADCVIVHSAAEAELLRQLAPDTEVRVVPWTVEPRTVATAAAKATTLAFIGGYRHPPNVDAATWAVRELMPRLRRVLPGIELLLVGSHMPDEVAALTAADVLPVGHVDSLDEIYAQARLTIAPLRYGAGLKGKALDSLAAGVPCVMSTIAAEGLELPEALQVLVADEPEIVARRIAMLSRDDREYRRLAAAGQTYIADTYGAARIDALLHDACGTASRAASGPERGVSAPAISNRRRGSRAGSRLQAVAATALAGGDGK